MLVTVCLVSESQKTAGARSCYIPELPALNGLTEQIKLKTSYWYRS